MAIKIGSNCFTTGESIQKELDMTKNKLNAWKRAAIQTRAVEGFRRRTSVTNSEPQSDWNTRKKIQYGNTNTAIWGIISEYCSNSTIHGVKYLGENKRPILERLFWIFVFGLSIFVCSQLTSNIWIKWDTNPVIVSFSKTATPIYEIPFPTITLCSETKVKRRFINFTAVYLDLRDGLRANMSTKILDFMEAVTQVCDLHLTTGLEFGFDNATTNGTDLINKLVETSLTLNDVFHECKWRNKVVPCSNVFQKVLTNEGVCYSFNSLGQRNIYKEDTVQRNELFERDFLPANEQNIDWDLEEGFRTDAADETIPKRVFAVGTSGGLELLLTSDQSEHDPICRGPTSGFKVLVHTPGEIQLASDEFFRIPLNMEAMLSINPEKSITLKELKSYDPKRRQCFFQNERNLRFFKLYTQANCEWECLTNFTLQNCGCVQFAMPRAIDTPVCGSLHIECVERSGYEMLKQVFHQEQKMKANVLAETGCNCLPSCTSIVYNAEISQATFDQGALTTSLRGTGVSKIMEENSNIKLSRFVVFFKERQFHSSERSELYGTTDFLANCGGLFGLFMGISALSIIELIYFCSVRLLTNLKMRRKKKNHVKTNLENIQPDTPKIAITDTSNNLSTI